MKTPAGLLFFFLDLNRFCYCAFFPQQSVSNFKCNIFCVSFSFTPGINRYFISQPILFNRKQVMLKRNWHTFALWDTCSLLKHFHFLLHCTSTPLHHNLIDYLLCKLKLLIENRNKPLYGTIFKLLYFIGCVNKEIYHNWFIFPFCVV